jgi:hypothetical protein
MMISSNSGTDFIALAKASGNDPMEIVNQPEFKEWFTEYLSENTITVEFTKKDGEKRRMFCTRDIGKIPVEQHPSGSKSVATDAVAVWDLEKSGWRSFNLSSLTRIEWSKLA